MGGVAGAHAADLGSATRNDKFPLRRIAWVVDGANAPAPRVSRRECAPRRLHGSRKQAYSNESAIRAKKDQQKESSPMTLCTCPGTVGRKAGRTPATQITYTSGEGGNGRYESSQNDGHRRGEHRATTVISQRRRDEKDRVPAQGGMKAPTQGQWCSTGERPAVRVVRLGGRGSWVSGGPTYGEAEAKQKQR